VDDHEQPERIAESEQDEPVFLIRMVWIVDDLAVTIGESRLRFLKRDPVLANVVGRFAGIPLEMQRYNYSIMLM
jgi:hypothetical protein